MCTTTLPLRSVREIHFAFRRRPERLPVHLSRRRQPLRPARNTWRRQQRLSENVYELLNVIPKHLVDAFDVIGAALFLEGKQEVYFFDETSRSLFQIDQLKAISDRGEPVLQREKRICYMPLRMGMRSVGSIGLMGCDLSRESLEAIGSLVAISIERTNTVEKLTRTEAARESDRLRSMLLDSGEHRGELIIFAFNHPTQTCGTKVPIFFGNCSGSFNYK